MARSQPVLEKKSAQKQGLRRKAGIALLQSAPLGKQVLLVLQRNGQWSLPKGGCKPGESAKKACLRECREETGFEPRNVAFLSCGMNTHKTVILYLWKSEVPSPSPENNGIRIGQTEIRRMAWFSPAQAQRVLKLWQWRLLAKAFR